MIAVTTPTGNVGRHVMQMLIRAGKRPRVLVRDPTPFDATYVDAVQTDLSDPEQVAAATQGVEALYWVTPSDFEAADPLAAYARYAEAAAHAIEANGIERVVFQSSVGAELRHGAGEIDGLGATELALERVAPNITHLRCGYFFSNLLFQQDSLEAGTIPILTPPDAPMPWVDPRDIAEIATFRLLDRDWTGRHVQAVHGPEDLSWNDVTRILKDVLDANVDAVQIPDDEMREMLAESGMTDAQVEGMVGMSIGLRDGFTPEQPRDATTTTPSTLAAWLSVTFVQDAEHDAA